MSKDGTTMTDAQIKAAVGSVPTAEPTPASDPLDSYHDLAASIEAGRMELANITAKMENGEAAFDGAGISRARTELFNLQILEAEAREKIVASEQAGVQYAGAPNGQRSATLTPAAEESLTWLEKVSTTRDADGQPLLHRPEFGHARNALFLWRANVMQGGVIPADVRAATDLQISNQFAADAAARDKAAAERQQFLKDRGLA